MPTSDPTRVSLSAASLLFVVASIILVSLSALIFEVVAQVMGGNNPPGVLSEPDPVSDAVSATSADFRVSESGSANYNIPIYAVPGTAGVAPRLSLSYSSHGGYGPLGRGWALTGLSSINRCRAAREAGDYIGAATPDGNPRPINFSDSDRYCLDGQRLLPSSATCAPVSSMSATAYATELESISRVCAYSSPGSATGPTFFTVEKKDGSTSWYGDRDSNASGSNRPDGTLETTSALNPGAPLAWSQTRMQDSTGNYIDYVYVKNPAGTGTNEQHISEVRYTGKVSLAGQSTGASAPYAKIQFNYTTLPTSQWSKGYVAGGLVTSTQRLESVTSCATSAGIGCPTAQQARHVILTYAPSASGSWQDTLIGLQECRDSTAAVCSAATAFGWSQAPHAFSTYEAPPALSLATDHFKNFKVGDFNGDGRQDIAVLYLAGTGCSGGSWIISMLGTLNGAGQPSYSNATWNCVTANITTRGDGAWHIFDYNGDGRDDLFVSSASGQGWRLHPSNGTHFDMTTNLISALSPIVPSVTSESSQVQLADLNGDGLTDIVYPSGTALRARLMERIGSGYSWGAPRSVVVDETSLPPAAIGCDDPFDPYTRMCERMVSGTPTTKTGFMQMIDFNGDAASDLVMRVTTRAEVWTGYPGCEMEPQLRAQPSQKQSGLLSLWRNTDEQLSGTNAALADPCWERVSSDTLYALVVHSQDAATVVLRGFDVVANGDPHALVFADFNGDGLTDRAIRGSSTTDWSYSLNNGHYFLGGGVLTLSSYRDQVRFADVTGDGRADMLYLINYGSYKGYAFRRAMPDGTFSTGTTLQGANAKLCQGSSCNEQQRVPLFSDVDGDGNIDFQSIDFSGSNVSVAFSRGTPYQPRDQITSFVNGFGATTTVTYASLTNAAVYRRSTGTRDTAVWGRGSPVLDMLGSSLVVAYAASSAPTSSNPSALAGLHYRYANARIQAGGRGFLGFGTIETIDPNQTGGYVATTTQYAQNFPYVGFPLQTLKRLTLGSYSPSSCVSNPAQNACFSTPGIAHQDLGGQWFSSTVHSWEMSGSLTSSQSIHVRTQGTEEALRDPYTGEVTSRVTTAFSYASNGNVSQTAVDTYTGANTLVSSQTTQNTYSDDVTHWRLGRLTSTTVTHHRPGQPNIVRTSGFSYAMGGAATALLTEERVQPGGAPSLASATNYALDDFGNKTRATTCANPASNCSSTGFSFHPSSLDPIRRYSRTEYDSVGRYAVATFEPFWNGANGEERQTSYVIARNLFGDATDVIGLNNARTMRIYGLMGREYFQWTRTTPNATPGNGGSVSNITYRWCASGSNSVACPSGAVYRQQVSATAAPRQWTYFDILGRPILKAQETLNAAAVDKDVSGVCTKYDSVGRPHKTSNPFFLAGVAGSSGPTDVVNACSSPARLWTSTTYDTLGRLTSTQTPDGSLTSVSYSGLLSSTTNARNFTSSVRRNGKGEAIESVDPTGFATSFTYHADGNISTVTRNAGGGPVVNTFTYDTLGRKILQSDPDSGNTSFEYNGLGEVVAQVDNGGNRVEREIDARGRTWRVTSKLPGGVIETQATTEFDTSPNASGKASSQTMSGQYAAWSGQAGTAINYQKYLSYDGLGRLTNTMMMLDEGMYWNEVKYDSLGRPWKAQDASGLWTKTEFSQRGATAACASDSLDSTSSCNSPVDTYRRVVSTDAWGNVDEEILAGHPNLTSKKQYHALTGRVTQICAGGSSCNLVNENYVWDAEGNLASHQKEGRYVEEFVYDSLNRVVEGRLTMANGASVNQVLLATSYDQLGNICSKQGEAYLYPGNDGCVGGQGPTSGVSGPHAVSQVGQGTTARFFYYDDRGNQTLRDAPGSSNDRTVRYSSEGRPYEIQLGTGQTTRFWYGPDGQRYKRQDGTKVTLYIGDTELTLQGAALTAKRYPAGVAMQTVSAGVVQNTRYLLRDHLGSVIRVANPDGTVAESLDYSPYGTRRSPGNPAGTGTPSSYTARGFTGHEAIDDMSLVHMNGRVYDDELGRFLQTDPLVQSPIDGQSWNAYTYTFNNPLADTDPTGMFSIGRALFNPGAGLIRGAMRALGPKTSGLVVGVGCSYVPGPWAIACAAGGSYDLARTFGASPKEARKAAVAGAFTAAISYGIDVKYGGELSYEKVLVSAFAGGITAEVQGGNFGDGFVAAGVMAVVMPQLGYIDNDFVRTVVGAIVGGTVSDATGGNFANGAISGAIQGALTQRNEVLFQTNDGLLPMPEAGETPASRRAIFDQIVENRELYGINIPAGVTISFEDYYLSVTSSGKRLPCYSSCDDQFYEHGVVLGQYNRRTKEITVFRAGVQPFITTGVMRSADGMSAVIGITSRVSAFEAMVRTLGHEAAHARGIDIGIGGHLYHPNAEAAGLEAARRWRELFSSVRSRVL